MKRIAILGAPSLLGKGMHEAIKEAFPDEGYPLVKLVRNHTLMTVMLPEVRVWLEPHYEPGAVQQVTINDEAQLRRIFADMEQHAELCFWSQMLTVEDLDDASMVSGDPSSEVDDASPDASVSAVEASAEESSAPEAVEPAPFNVAVEEHEQTQDAEAVSHAQGESDPVEVVTHSDAVDAVAEVVELPASSVQEENPVEQVAPVEVSAKATRKKSAKGA